MEIFLMLGGVALILVVAGGVWLFRWLLEQPAPYHYRPSVSGENSYYDGEPRE